MTDDYEPRLSSDVHRQGLIRDRAGKGAEKSGLSPQFILACPRCGNGNVHLERVALQVRPGGYGSASEDVGIDLTGRLREGAEYMSKSEHEGAVAIVAWCEDGCRFTLSFTERKGETEVLAVYETDQPKRGARHDLGQLGHATEQTTERRYLPPAE